MVEKLHVNFVSKNMAKLILVTSDSRDKVLTQKMDAEDSHYKTYLIK